MVNQEVSTEKNRKSGRKDIRKHGIRFRDQKFSTKLIIGFLAIMFTVAIISYFFTMNLIQNALQKSYGKESVIIAQQTVNEIDSSLHYRIEQLQIFSARLAEEEGIIKSNHDFKQLDNIQEYIDQKDKEWTSVPEDNVTPFMQTLIDNHLSEDLRKEILEFDIGKHGRYVFGEVFVTNKYGANVAQTGKTSDYYQADEDWWQKAKQNGLYLEDVEYDQSAGMFAISIVIRINDRKGNFLGIMKTVMSIEELVQVAGRFVSESDSKEEIQDSEKFNQVGIKILNKNGLLIYSSKPGFKILEDLSEEKAFNRIISTDSGYFMAKGLQSKEEELIAYAHSQGFEDFEGLGFIVVEEHSSEEIFEETTKLRSMIFIVAAIATLICVFGSFILSRYATNPIRNLIKTTREIAHGDLSKRVEVKSKDEFGQLALVFNKMAATLQQSHEGLEDKVRVKTKELAENLKKSEQQNKSLEESKKAMLNILEDLEASKKATEQEKARVLRQKNELENVNRELDNFSYTASHDLRAPLRAISSFASFLEEDYVDKLDDEGRDYLAEIRKGADRMSKLTEDLLALSRISRIKNPYENVNVNDLLNSIKQRIKTDIEENRVNLEIQEDIPIVKCDRIKIGEVFLNLINNAIKFSAKNNKENPRVQVGCIVNKEFYQFFVKDNGIGIDPKYHKQVFGIFKRLHTDREYEGTGAGLSIVKRVVDDHGGRIWIESGLGKGAVFYFTIPMHPKETKEKESKDKHEESSSNVPEYTGDILVNK